MDNVLKTFNVKVSGRGVRPLLFAHGLGCDQNVWRHVSSAFAEDYKIILFDYVGCGESDITQYDREHHSSLHGYANDVLKICAALELKDVIFIGHSVSSMIGLLAAIKQPAIFSKLVMIGPSPCYLNDPPYQGGFDRQDLEMILQMMKQNYEQWAGYFAPKVMGNADKPQLGDSLAKTFCKADPAITCDFAGVTFFSDNRKDLKNLTIPTFILQPADDIVAPKHIGEYLAKEIPHSSLYYMKATGHFPHLSAVPETVDAIKLYLKSQ